jgi:hypothetical protein
VGSDVVESVVGFVRVLGLSDRLQRCCAPERNGSEAAESHRVGFPRNVIPIRACSASSSPTSAAALAYSSAHLLTLVSFVVCFFVFHEWWLLRGPRRELITNTVFVVQDRDNSTQNALLSSIPPPSWFPHEDNISAHYLKHDMACTQQWNQHGQQPKYLTQSPKNPSAVTSIPLSGQSVCRAQVECRRVRSVRSRPTGPSHVPISS